MQSTGDNLQNKGVLAQTIDGNSTVIGKLQSKCYGTFWQFTILKQMLPIKC